MKQQKNIPALRFPGFKGEWEQKKLGEVAEIKTGNKDTQNKVEDGLYPFFVRSNTVERINSYSYDGEAILTSGDGVGVGRNFHYISGKFDFHQRVYSLRNFKTGYHGKFLYNVFSEKFYDRVIRLSAKNSVDSVRMEMISEMEISFPTLPEQQKIADFLTAVDEKLQSLKKKKNLLEQYKKGVMQQLFIQQLRFKDAKGKDFPDWEEKQLGEIGETYGGLSGKTKENFGKGKPYIQYKQIFDDSKIDISRFELVDIAPNENQNKVQFGDVFFTVSSETPNEIGMSSVLLDKIDELYLNSFCFGYRANSLQILSPYFSRYLFRSEIFRTEIIKLAQGSTRYNMSKIQLLKIEIRLPSFPEQTAIAQFLSALDNKIAHTQQQIVQTEQWKKGLLQQLFV